MKKRFRSFTAVLLALLMVTTTFSAMPLTVSAAEATEDSVGVISGTAGNCTWTLEDNGVLTISKNETVTEQPVIPTSEDDEGSSNNYETFDIPDYPDNSAPWGAYEFSEVIIEDGVTSIGDYAFSNCINLKHVMIPDSVTSIGNSSFSNCPNLTIYGKDNSYAKTYANSNNIEFVTVKDCGRTGECLWLVSTDRELIICGNGAMSDYSCSNFYTTAPWKRNITKVTIEDGVTKIGIYAFYGCEKITSVSIPESVTSIDSRAFLDCRGLTSIDLPNSVTSIGESAFSECTGLTSIDLPNSVTSIDSSAFLDCRGLTSIVLPNSVTSIGSYAFAGCTGLTSIVLPNSLTSIGSHAFSECNSLTSIDLPNSVTSIDTFAFSSCGSLTSINIPSSVTKIGHGAFCRCKNLSSLTVSEGNEKYDSRNNCNAIIGTASNALIQGCNNTVIPDSVTSIYDYAFDGFTNITSITIPESVTKIYAFAFSGCGLTSITIPNSVTSIGYYAFFSSGLTSITIPNSVTRIGCSAFENCKDLVNINLPDSITSIDICTFRYCSSLTEVIIPNSVTSIGEQAFLNCNSLKSVVISDSVTNIGSYAFGYYYEKYKKRIEDFVIIGHKNSEAQRYADKYVLEFIPFELGEINSDGAIDIRDVTAIQKGLAGLSELSDIQLVAADVNADKAVDVNDATHMQKYLAYLIDELG